MGHIEHVCQVQDPPDQPYQEIVSTPLFVNADVFKEEAKFKTETGILVTFERAHQ